MIKVVSNLGKVYKKWLTKQKALKSTPRAAHREMAIMLDRWVLMNFKGEGSKVGGWKPFKVYCVGGPRSPYRKRKICASGRVMPKGRLDKSASLLQDTGRLRASFKMFYDDKNAGIGSKLKYAEPHEKGTKDLPQRRMLPNHREVKKDVVNIYNKHIQKALKKR